ncbi:MAG: hypothetical protein HC848_10205 [Limnobacter sp.]|nr:hypothetical protein [Limnobacter sp.]
MADLAQQAVGKARCMNVWGGCVPGLLVNGVVIGTQPAMVVAVFGKEFEVSDGKAPALVLNLSESDAEQKRFQAPVEETDTLLEKSDSLGLLSYGANYRSLPRIEHGRPCRESDCRLELAAQKTLTFNSEGLVFLSEPLEVTECKSLFLVSVDGKAAATALACPQHQTRPVGLRLQVIQGQTELWVPVLNIMPDGSLALAAPVSKGQRVRLARRTETASLPLMAWKNKWTSAFSGNAPAFGLIFAGFERSRLCHNKEQDIEKLAELLCNTPLVGVLGQAVWLEQNQKILSPPRNNRLTLTLVSIPQHKN